MRRLQVLLLFFTLQCTTPQQRLPILGPVQLTEQGDTIYHQIPPFRFVDQDSQQVTEAFFKDKIVVVDFFFTTCPSICPVMKRQMHRVYKAFEGNPHVGFLSHTIDPEHDSVAVLKAYAQRLGVSNQWRFVTGNKDSIYTIAEQGYMVAVAEDAAAPGGYVHSGNFLLIDPQRHIRGVYLGTDEESVNKLIKDMKILLKEYGWE